MDRPRSGHLLDSLPRQGHVARLRSRAQPGQGRDQGRQEQEAQEGREEGGRQKERRQEEGQRREAGQGRRLEEDPRSATAGASTTSPLCRGARSRRRSRSSPATSRSRSRRASSSSATTPATTSAGPNTAPLSVARTPRTPRSALKIDEAKNRLEYIGGPRTARASHRFEFKLSIKLPDGELRKNWISAASLEVAKSGKPAKGEDAAKPKTNGSK